MAQTFVKSYIAAPEEIGKWVKELADLNGWSVSFAWVYLARLARAHLRTADNEGPSGIVLPGNGALPDAPERTQ